MKIELSALRRAIKSPGREYSDLIHFTLDLLTPQSAFEVARLAVARHVAFYEKNISKPEMVHAWLLVVTHRQSLKDRKDVCFYYWQEDPKTLQYSIYSGFSFLTSAYVQTFFPEELKVNFGPQSYVYDGLLTLMHCLMREITEKFSDAFIDLEKQDDPEFNAKMTRVYAFINSPERLKLQHDIWLPVIEDMERLFLLQDHAYPSKGLGQMADHWPWPDWSYQIWDRYLGYKIKKDTENSSKED